jgi:hypothetical protein
MLVEMESFWVIARAVIITIYPSEPSLVELFIEEIIKSQPHYHRICHS